MWLIQCIRDNPENLCSLNTGLEQQENGQENHTLHGFENLDFSKCLYTDIYKGLWSIKGHGKLWCYLKQEYTVYSNGPYGMGSRPYIPAWCLGSSKPSVVTPPAYCGTLSRSYSGCSMCCTAATPDWKLVHPITRFHSV